MDSSDTIWPCPIENGRGIIKTNQTPLLLKMNRSEQFKRKSQLSINGFWYVLAGKVTYLEL